MFVHPIQRVFFFFIIIIVICFCIATTTTVLIKIDKLTTTIGKCHCIFLLLHMSMIMGTTQTMSIREASRAPKDSKYDGNSSSKGNVEHVGFPNQNRPPPKNKEQWRSVNFIVCHTRNKMNRTGAARVQERE